MLGNSPRIYKGTKRPERNRILISGYYDYLCRMLQNFIASRIQAQLPFEPTEQQTKLIEDLGAFLMSTDNEKAFLLKGYAGTGKTSVVSALVRALNELK